MTQDLQIIEHSTSLAMPEMDVETAVERFKQLGQFVKTIMRPGTDYGVIPGTPKPTLLKPGAEKLSTFFGLTKEEQILSQEMDWTGQNNGGEPFFYFHYLIRLSRNGRLVAEADGSANSWESKHRYRQGEYKCPACGKETIRKSKEDKGGGWYCWSKLGGCGKQWPKGDKTIEGQDVGKKKNPDPADLVNTIQKMAYKRALVAATLVAVNASEYFTQDIEDLPEFTPPEPPPLPPAPEKKGGKDKPSVPVIVVMDYATQDQLNEIESLAPKAQIGIMKILEKYKVGTLSMLTREQANSTLDKLAEIIETLRGKEKGII